MDWAAELGIGLDFNPTCFSHPKAADGFTLTHRDEAIRKFWVEHGIACRKIGEAFGRRLKTPAVTNFWIPDGMKDVTIDRKGPREILKQSLDEMFAPPIDPAFNRDSVESKLFGIGSETYVVGLARVLSGLRRGQAEAALTSTPAISIPRKRSPTRSPRC